MALNLNPREELEQRILNAMSLFNSFNDSALGSPAAEPKTIVDKILKATAEGIKHPKVSNNSTQADAETSPLDCPLEKDRVSIHLGGMGLGLAQEMKRDFLNASLRVLVTEAGIDFNDVGIQTIPRPRLFAGLFNAIFGSQIVVTLPDKRSAEMLIAQAGLEIRKQERPLPTDGFSLR